MARTTIPGRVYVQSHHIAAALGLRRHRRRTGPRRRAGPGDRQGRPHPADDRRSGVDRQADRRRGQALHRSRTATPSPARRSKSSSRTTPASPDKTKRLAQELIVNDKVNVIAGFGLTPAALAAAPIATQAQGAADRHGGRHLDHHRALALYRAHQLHPGAVLDHHRRLGGEERHQEGRDAGLRLRARHRRAQLRSRSTSPRAAARSSKRSSAARQSGLRAVPAARDGRQARRRSSSSCRPARAAPS